MTQPATNAQVALQCAATLRASKNTALGGSWNETIDLFTFAGRLLTWLNDHTPPAPDQPGELG